MYIRPFTREDLPAAGPIAFASFEDDELFAWMYPRKDLYPDDLRRFQAMRLRTRVADVGSHGFAAVTEEGDEGWTGKPELAGFAFCERRGKDVGAAKWQRDSIWNKIDRYLLSWQQWYEEKVFNRHVDPQRLEFYIEASQYDIYDRIKDCWHLGFIAVSPKFQRRGYGRKLVQHCQKIAADDGVPMTLEASAAGRGLYSKVGFKIINQKTIVNGLDGVTMLWEPINSKGKLMEDLGKGRAKLL